MGFGTKATLLLAAIYISSSEALAPTVPKNLSTLLTIEQPKKINYDDILWMAMNIYYEARNQPRLGKIAVGIVTINRKKENESIHNVVTDPYQFSWYNSYIRNKKVRMPKDSEIWQECLRIAKYVLTLNATDDIMILLDGATHYHTTKVYPSWRRSMEKIVQINDHIFYRKK